MHAHGKETEFGVHLGAGKCSRVVRIQFVPFWFKRMELGQHAEFRATSFSLKVIQVFLTQFINTSINLNIIV